MAVKMKLSSPTIVAAGQLLQGVGYYKDVTQFDAGEYPHSNNPQVNITEHLLQSTSNLAALAGTAGPAASAAQACVKQRAPC